MDHTGHGSHQSSHDEVRATGAVDTVQEDAVSHDSCVTDALPAQSMPTHGACLGCCPESTGTSEAVSVDRRLSGPFVTIVPKSLFSLPGAVVDRPDSPGVPNSLPMAPTVLRL
jgi:hypothetical protein